MAKWTMKIYKIFYSLILIVWNLKTYFTANYFFVLNKNNFYIFNKFLYNSEIHK